jgi:DNA-binding GntR family transcriptional regulator
MRVKQAEHPHAGESDLRELASGHSPGSLTNRAHQVLRAAILCGDIDEGKFLTEAKAREKFKIGHTPFREACNRLIYEGFLELMPRRGYFVPQMTLRKVRNFFEARTFVEGHAAELAALRAKSDQIKQMGAILKHRLPSILNASTIEVIVKANSEFHQCLAEMTQNDEIAGMVRSLLDRSARIVYLFRAERPTFHVHAIHQQIFDAIRKRDAEKARTLVIADIQVGQSELFQ